jgi:hypothetical protein
MSDPFVLELAENPHPAMMLRALAIRASARAAPDHVTAMFWSGYLDAMCDATGETPDAINQWLDDHERGRPGAVSSQPVHVRHT